MFTDIGISERIGRSSEFCYGTFHFNAIFLLQWLLVLLFIIVSDAADGLLELVEIDQFANRVWHIDKIIRISKWRAVYDDN